MSDTPRIYVACLAAYNAGRLHGEWIDVTDADTMQAEIQAMLSASPAPLAEEWAIHDYDGFHGLDLSESEDLDTLVSLAEFLEEHGEIGARFLSQEGLVDDPEEGARQFEDRHRGEYRSLEDFAEESLSDLLNDVPESVRMYFDFERYARDLEDCGDISTISLSHDCVHVFSAQ